MKTHKFSTSYLRGDKVTWEQIFDLSYMRGDKMSWRHLYLIHLTWAGIKWHERGLDDSVWPPLREFWGSVARRKGHHSLPAKSIISSHHLSIFLHFIFFFCINPINAEGGGGQICPPTFFWKFILAKPFNWAISFFVNL